jgi:hypothetical protein
MRVLRNTVLAVSTVGVLSCDTLSPYGNMPVAKQGGALTFVGKVGSPFNLTEGFRLLGDTRRPKYIVVVPASLASNIELDGDVGFVCEEVGSGILWVYFQLTDDPNTSFYDLSCDHSQGIGG